MSENTQLRAQAEEIAKARYSFRWHLPIYLAVNLGLVGIWYYAGADPWGFWPIFPIACWGAGVVSHYVKAYRRSIGEKWIAKETEKILREKA
ncbi:MAG: 2TM domain-containing protein [Candidatus Bathyarchaeota archaeon]